MPESTPRSALKPPKFTYVCKSNDINSSMGITSDGTLYTWGSLNTLGILGRKGKCSKPFPATFDQSDSDKSSPNQVTTTNPKKNVQVSRCFVGGTKDAGHSAVIDTDGNLWLTGCDRWQQLGLGSAAAGAAGYTWKDGRLWQETFQKNEYISELMHQTCGRNGDMNNEGEGAIRDVAIGGDHTLVLAKNQKDVFSFGKGSEGQLGIVRKPFVSAPIRAKELSNSTNESKISAVCAIRHCSFTLDHEGKVLKKAGKCRLDKNLALSALRSCREKAIVDELIKDKKSA